MELDDTAIARATQKSYLLMDNFQKRQRVDFSPLQFPSPNKKDELLQLFSFLENTVKFLDGQKTRRTKNEFLRAILRAFEKGLMPIELLKWASNRPRPVILFKEVHNIDRASSSERVEMIDHFLADLDAHTERDALPILGNARRLIALKDAASRVSILDRTMVVSHVDDTILGNLIVSVRTQHIGTSLEIAGFLSRFPTTLKRWVERKMGHQLRTMAHWEACRSMTANLAATTAKRYVKHCEAFGKYVLANSFYEGPIYSIYQSENIITYKKVEAWRNSLTGTNVPDTILNKTMAILWLMKCFGISKFCKKDFVKHHEGLVKALPYVPDKRSAPDESTIFRFWKFWNSTNNTYDEKVVLEMARCCYTTAARVSEILTLKRENVIEETIDTPIIQIFPQSEKSSTKRGYILPLNFTGESWWSVTKLIRIRINQTEEGDHLYTNLRHQPFTYGFVNRVHNRKWTHFVEMYPKYQPLKAGWHMYRSSKACQFREQGFSEEEIRLLGRWRGGETAYLRKREFSHVRNLAQKAESISQKPNKRKAETFWDSLYRSQTPEPPAKKRVSFRQITPTRESIESEEKTSEEPNKPKTEYQKVLDSIKESYTQVKHKSTRKRVTQLMVEALSDLHEKINDKIAVEEERRKSSPTQRSVRRELEKLGVPQVVTPPQSPNDSPALSTVETSAKKVVPTFGKKRAKRGVKPIVRKLELSPEVELKTSHSPDILNLKTGHMLLSPKAEKQQKAEDKAFLEQMEKTFGSSPENSSPPIESSQ